MENTINTAPKDLRNVSLQEEISRRAHDIWETTGKPEGRANEFWLEAERQVIGADPSVRIDGNGAVSAEQFTQATNANGAKSRGRGKK